MILLDVLISLERKIYMRWRDRQGSKNVQSSSGRAPRGNGGFGRGGGRIPLPIGGLLGGGGGIGLIILLVVFLMLSDGFGGGVAQNNNGVQPNSSKYEQNQDFTGKEGDPQTAEEMRHFLAVSLKDSEDTWEEIFAKHNSRYNAPTLHTFTEYVQSGCGGASKAVGPFYCSLDRTIYIDMSFYSELKNKFGASGDFTMSYVLSHEVGHHVQNELGILEEAHKMMRNVSKKEANEISVRLELQVDYFAGVVAKYQDQKGYLSNGDIKEAITAAQAIGDDVIQKKAQGYVVPENFTHGSAAQRMYWYKLGFEHGDLEHGDTFSMSFSELQEKVSR